MDLTLDKVDPKEKKRPEVNLRLGGKVQIRNPRSSFEMVSASEFTTAQLTDIYNQTRLDYLVPMPMSRAKLEEYVHNYDVDLAQSLVVTTAGSPLGLAMLGVRQKMTWITRLGIMPDGRQKGAGRALMNRLIENSRRLGARTIILEVIRENKPARRLFNKVGFKELRELRVIRRPPVQVSEPDNPRVEKLGYQQAVALLEKRTDSPSWVTANQSLLNAGNLAALVADFPNLGRGWLVYQNTPFQLGRVTLQTDPEAPLEVAINLLKDLHVRHPIQDTVVENLPLVDRHWPAFQALDYMVSFVRVEMRLDFGDNSY